ncbi:SDR family NAD(P)-dependent oxidoreductase [Microvirga sp. 17 mud 1-3]|uniref:SDR family NAD(P)-dependent oxidoreductase n=1 Tax=Microvirga sp. 17 mud 1-3 TaxID=2082949 RepID=UPI000D6B4B1C|nr:glucose 1-dehydrogenase [Microvirga sp. 17 mud 1-3]AWM85534.1 short-chain dehydrogenase [Microvirga sp. 17 mud 1-3]
MKKLKDKVAVVTGGNSGIGLAAAKAFVTEGAKVVIVGRRADAVSATVEELGSDATGLTGDVAELTTHDRLVSLIKNQFGGIDIYFANAGTNTITPTEAVSVEEFDTQFATNTRGVFFGVQRVLPLIREGGSIILTSSIASEKVLEGHAVYAGTKAAVEAFARSWALELKDRRIRVNVLSPGPVDTPILAKLGVAAEARLEFEAQTAQAIPLGRLGRPDELASAALFLASDDSSFVTGANIRVDGGIALT